MSANDVLLQRSRRFCIAPMMDWTDRHCRYLLRLIFPEALLYTEMVTTGALKHGDRERFLAYDAREHPLALQLGGSDVDDMLDCARIAEDHAYDEVNINAGCPSDRVQAGAFGACLMAEPERVADCVNAMCNKVQIPVTVKSRIGIDNLDQYEHLHRFVSIVAQAGCRVFIVHARKAWLKGLSPKQNREIPPLHYDFVHRLKTDFPELTIVLNGGLKTTADIVGQLQFVDGVMVGREAYQNPYSLIDVRRAVFDCSEPCPSRIDIVGQYMDYIKRQLAQGVYLKHMARHMLGLFQGVPGAKYWRRHLTENVSRHDAGYEIIETALAGVMAASNFNPRS